jgi:hypothetical protein
MAMSSEGAKPKGCHSCGSENIDWGWLGILQAVVFYGEVVRQVAAYACMDCGHIQLRIKTDSY